MAALLVGMFALVGSARADALDDALAKFLDDKFSSTEQAVAGVALAAPPQGADIVSALGDGRLFVDPANQRVLYKTPPARPSTPRPARRSRRARA